MRGKVFCHRVSAGGLGITPAHAGKRLPSSACIWPCWDHPRTCGEKFRDENLEAPLMGSPPHMRGKALIVVCGYSGRWDHPRTCGEKIDETTNTNEATGSPPHMRGKVVVVVVGPVETGITPAHAGKSASAALSPASPRDHPRTCGEKLYRLLHGFLFLGSPPHMRGKAFRES